MKSNVRIKNNDNSNIDKDKILYPVKNDSGITLSIGMIVKNEERHLEKCLSALQKLRDQVSNELIIVDTGSTDRTKEIALKYTDKVYDFEWINDFAAARNHGLEKAVGEWFMFIDADEYLDEDCSEMVKFFNMKEVSKQYNSASYYIRNYGSETSKRATNQFLASRIVRRLEGVKFHDAIHEWVPQPPPHGVFGTVFHHYGYAYVSKEVQEQKGKRNIEPLLEEYKRKPKDLRVLCHISDMIYNDTYFKTAEEKEKYINEYLEESRKRISEPYSFMGFIKSSSYYTIYKKYDKAIEILKEFVNLDCAQRSSVMVMAYYNLASIYMNKEKYEEAYEAILKYEEYYFKFKENKLDTVDMRFSVLQGLTEYDYKEVAMHAARSLNNLERYDEAIAYLDKMDIEDLNFPQLKIFLNIMRDLFKKTKKYEYAINCYEKILKLNDPDKTELILFMLERYYLENLYEREEFAKQVVKYGTNGKYVELMRIVKDDFAGEDVSDRLLEFINSVDRWNDGYSESIFLAMKHNVDVSGAIKNMSHKSLKDLLSIISDGHPYDYSKVALEYCSYFDYSQNINCTFWCMSALEAAVHKSRELSDDMKPYLFDTFIEVLSTYVYNIYNNDFLNNDDVEVLPELHRFGYYMSVAFTAKGEGDIIGYIRNLKEALRLCEPMKDLVAFYLNELEEEMKNS